MHVGMAAVFQNTGRQLSDRQIYLNELALADMAEPLGFESIWSVEHHFTDYTMCPDVVQFLSYMAGRTRNVKLGSMVVVLPWHDPMRVAEQISMLDQLSGGRICVNLIAGQSEAENESEGIKWGKEERYEIMDEEVSILKALWTARGPLTWDGKFYQLKGAQIRPHPLQKPYPKFYLGGGSKQAWEISAKHSDVHLFWGDTYERIRANMVEIRGMAARHGRADDIGFGMRLQVVCRPTEKEAWEFAHELVAHATEAQKAFVKERFATSEANRRVWSKSPDHDVAWPKISGIAKKFLWRGYDIIAGS